MANPIERPVLSYRDLRVRAADFLRTHHPSGTIPVPIEEIVEFKYRIDIIPVHGLHHAFEIDGFISNDFKTITVDLFFYEHRPNRYRFTLAHELAHAILHRKIFRTFRFKKIDDWKQFQGELSEEDRAWLEWQAYAFVGLVLVPLKP